jgi:lipooligosaccharide transport system permease protein
MSSRAGALHIVEYDAMVFRRVWRGTIMTTFLNPLFFLAAMGWGLGAFVNRGAGGVGGVPYLEFLAPGLLATSTMQTAAGECMYPLLGKLMWDRTYEAILATSMRIGEVIVGEVAWITLRLLMVSTIFFVVMIFFGVVHSPLTLLVIPAAVLTGLAFATPIMAFTATQRDETGFPNIFRFGIMPLFLLGGAFFPISQLPLVLQAVAWATPLTHGVALCRSLVVGNAVPGEVLLHVGVMAAYAIGGFFLARRLFVRRLAK